MSLRKRHVLIAALALAAAMEASDGQGLFFAPRRSQDARRRLHSQGSRRGHRRQETSENLVQLVEECVSKSDGAVSQQALHAFKGADGWRIVVAAGSH
jgi:hypothetical protein